MKKSIIILFIIILSFNLVGCLGKIDTNGSNVEKSIDNRYSNTNDKYKIGNVEYQIYYDSTTNIVYIVSPYGNATGISTMYNINAKPMTLDEYNNSNTKSKDDRFIAIGDKYKIGNVEYQVYYDSITNIVYLVSPYGNATGITAIYDVNGKPMNLDEYKVYKNKI